ncbi:hypothetical protein BT67DRAFT_494146 [Trichocladium antarcticum]|uniref:Uncharacterized protein n=1 Tax=Trichocladium antarcticum TaxID=1450529 RepID=A0AAN6UM57_9PEZI|nr:hypothetical protein BT67DRAFT_494146 [Trichocladium antarcticum]
MSGDGFITIHQATPRHAATPIGARPPPPPPPPHPTGYGGNPGARMTTVMAQPTIVQPYPPRPATIAVSPQLQQHQQFQQQRFQQQQQLQQQQQQQQQQYAAPYVAHANTPVKISDIRKERPPTTEEAREALSEYSVFRFQKVDAGSGYGSDGERKKPSWKRALRVEVPGIPKHEVARTVRELNRTTISAAKKKAMLSPDEQRQIEVTLEEVRKFDNAFFQTTLAQIDDQVRPVKSKEKSRDRDRDRDTERGRGRPREKERDRRASRHRKEHHRHVVYGERRASSKPPSKSTEAKTAKTERVTLTAYFKRSPRPETDPIAMLQIQHAQRDAQIRRGMQQVYAQQAARTDVRPEVAHSAPAIAPPPPHGIPVPRPGENAGNGGPGLVNHGHGHDQGHGKVYYADNRGPAVTIVQPSAHRALAIAAPDHRHPSPRRPSPHPPSRRQPSPRRPSPRRPSPRRRFESPPSTASSTYSETFSLPDSDDTSGTSPSTASFPSRPGSYVRTGPAKTTPRFPSGPSPNFANPRAAHPAAPMHIPTPHPHLHPGPGTAMGTPHPPQLHPHNNHHHAPAPAAPTPPATALPRPIPIPPTTTTTTTTTTQQIYDSAYAAGRADTRAEAMSMAERIATAAATAATAAAQARSGGGSSSSSDSDSDGGGGGGGIGGGKRAVRRPRPYGDVDWARERERSVRSGVRIVRAPRQPLQGGCGGGYGRGGERGGGGEGLGRGMETLRVRVDEQGGDELGFRLDLDEERRGGRPYALREGGGDYPRRGLPQVHVDIGTEVRRGGGWEDEERGERVRRDGGLRIRGGDEQRAREGLLRRRDPGVHGGVGAVGSSNPFNPRPGLGRRTATATAAGGYDSVN